MIIKGSLHALRQKNVAETAMAEAVHDIDEEVERLNRIVNEVLDFARPIKFDVSSTDVNELCRRSATASQAAGAGATVSLDLDPAAGAMTTDGERLRIALVNMLVNARHAVQSSVSSHQSSVSSHQSSVSSHQSSVSSQPSVTLRTRANGNGVAVIIADN